VAFGAQIILGVLTYFVGPILERVVIWLIAAAVLLIWLRVVLHFALLEEGAEHLTIGPPSACPDCDRLVPTMRFCPNCGVVRAASPKHDRPLPMETAPLAR
jgi:hypothetical protein